jgi:SSS family solute:Na+ symporter
MVPGGIVAFIVIFLISAIDIKMGVKPAKELDLH